MAGCGPAVSKELWALPRSQELPLGKTFQGADEDVTLVR